MCGIAGCSTATGSARRRWATRAWTCTCPPPAGGGLQMMVTGLVKQMTGRARSASRSAPGDRDGRHGAQRRPPPARKIQLLRQLRPDDPALGRHRRRRREARRRDGGAARRGGSQSAPRRGLRTAGDLRGQPRRRAGRARQPRERTALKTVANLRPQAEREHLGPARDAIHDLFMEHVMAHAPGYKSS